MEFKITKKSCFFGALILVAITLPFPNRINTLSIWFMILIWIFGSTINEKKIKFKSNRLITLFISLYILYALGLIWGDYKSGVFEIEKRLSLFLFPVVLGTSSRLSSKELRIIMVSFAISCIIISGICLINTFYSNYYRGIPYTNYNSWLFSSTSLTEKFGFHPSYFSIYSVFSVFILLNILYNNKNISKFRKLLIGIIIIYLVIFIMFLASRIGIISLFILLFISILFYSYKKRKLLYGTLISLLIFVSIIFSIQFFTITKEKFNGLIKNGSENSKFSSTLRLEKWESTLTVIKENILIGVGTGNLQSTLQEIYKKKIYTEAYQNQYNPHNQFLDIAATLGIIGLLLFVICLFYPLYLGYKSKSYLYIVFILLFVFISLVESTLATQKGLVLYAFFNSLFAFHSLKNSKLDEKLH